MDPHTVHDLYGSYACNAQAELRFNATGLTEGIPMHPMEIARCPFHHVAKRRSSNDFNGVRSGGLVEGAFLHFSTQAIDSTLSARFDLWRHPAFYPTIRRKIISIVLDILFHIAELVAYLYLFVPAKPHVTFFSEARYPKHAEPVGLRASSRPLTDARSHSSPSNPSSSCGTAWSELASLETDTPTSRTPTDTGYTVRTNATLSSRSLACVETGVETIRLRVTCRKSAYFTFTVTVCP